MGFIINQVVQTVIEKCAKIKFVTTWGVTTMKEMGDKFHQKFWVSLQANLKEKTKSMIKRKRFLEEELS
jgi:hypothetical protein